jgi:hypothetical protein
MRLLALACALTVLAMCCAPKGHRQQPLKPGAHRVEAK